MKTPIAIISTDRHLNEDNAIELLDLTEQEIKLAIDLGVNKVIWLGDIFDSRISQRQELLNCLDIMLQMYHESGIQVYCIPGNHDKTDYEADESFLSPYRHHPSFYLFSEPCSFIFDDIEVKFVPFYSQNLWLEKFNSLTLPKNKRSILFSHTAVQGSINNDGKVVENKISLKLFKPFGKVFLGHYHNAQQPGSNVFHLPSIRQNNFGEDEEKGFTVLYDDLSFKLIKSEFTSFRNIKVDVMTTTKEDVLKLTKMAKDGSKLQVTLMGDKQTIKSINKKIFTDNGIAVKIKYDDISYEETKENLDVGEKLTSGDLIDKFKIFCAEKNYVFEDGLEILKKIMKWKTE